jgi:hypothetical protein
MTTSLENIREWLRRGKSNKDITHLIVVCDTFSYEDYPVYITAKESVRERFNGYDGKNMQKVMEVYSFKIDLESQINERRSFHFD